jgi:hypothetical protein
MPSRPVSNSQFTANRRNAKKSTGPRSMAGKIRASRNALRHGHFSGSGGYARLVTATMQDLGEDAAEYSRLLQSLMDDCQPHGISQTLLVEDLASLRWERQRLERARAALVARRVQELELKHQRASLEVDQQINEHMPAAILEAGMFWAPDSATKFQKLLEWLELLKQQQELHVFARTDTLLLWIYGKTETPRSKLIRLFFQQLADEQAASQAAARSRPDGKTGKAGDDQTGPSAESYVPSPGLVARLRRELQAEICNVSQRYHLHIREHVEVTPVMRGECLAPTADQRWLMRELNMVDRQIEKKSRLLWAMKERQTPGPEPDDAEGHGRSAGGPRRRRPASPRVTPGSPSGPAAGGNDVAPDSPSGPSNLQCSSWQTPQALENGSALPVPVSFPPQWITACAWTTGSRVGGHSPQRRRSQESAHSRESGNPVPVTPARQGTGAASNGLFNGTKPICIENKGSLEERTQTKPISKPLGTWISPVVSVNGVSLMTNSMDHAQNNAVSTRQESTPHPPSCLGHPPARTGSLAEVPFQSVAACWPLRGGPRREKGFAQAACGCPVPDERVAGLANRVRGPGEQSAANTQSLFDIRPPSVTAASGPMSSPLGVQLLGTYHTFSKGITGSHDSKTDWHSYGRR